ncbi:NPC intracellular cholesterol transporter 1-like [Chelonus insularis]|uniref:NPC intracellular cholesterol transporter 1-like n=1 Tax=Chelonus insularis TaxID=460826 RepID=UPI00158CEF5D|nr:NPC intracellular cholesterol transporter 1-like [Chelonus insularis]
MEVEKSVVKRKSFCDRLKKIPASISSVVKHLFFQLGLRIARHPIRWIICCSLLVLLCLGGFLKFRQERNPLRLWIPPDSDFVKDSEWLMDQFGEGQRTETMILTADNVLEPYALYEMNEIMKKILSIQVNKQLTWTDVCFKVPVISGYSIARQQRDIDDDDFFDEEPSARMDQSNFDPSVHTSAKVYCRIFNTLPKGCLIFSILDLWEYDSNKILSQTKNDIITKINSVKISPTLGHPINFTELLGGVVKDNMGKIISARAMKNQWMLHVNFTNINMNNAGNDVGTSDWATIDVLNWEAELLKELHASSELLKKKNKENNKTLQIWYQAGRSFGDISESTMFQDMKKIIIGIILMTLYVQVILSRFNWVEWRSCLTSAGLLCVGGAFIVAVGLCSLFGVPYGPVHSSLPFMLMGLGVDDIFVMMASWEEGMSHELIRSKSIDERIAHMLSHAGAAISITSLTDVIAFIIGASTILPSLESFCIYAAVGVFVTFLLQVTFFVAIFTLDVKRIESKRNGIFPCIIHDNYDISKNDLNQRLSWRVINTFYTKVVLKTPGKIIIILITCIFTIVSGMGVYQLKQWFDPDWFLPTDSYLHKFIEVKNREFPTRGKSAAIYIADIDYIMEYSKIMTLIDKLMNMTVVDNLEAWPQEFAQFVQRHYDKDVTNNSLQSNEFYFYLSKFLFSPSGGKYQRNFRFDGNLTCGMNTPRILLSTINFAFTKFSGPDQWIPAMDSTKLAVKEVGFSGYATVWSRIFGAWVTDKVIAREVTRNIILALICVMATTAVLIAEPQTCIWILLCVSLTLVDICGFMYYWGLSIDIVSCIALELAVGLSVDYAAHVAHAFLNSNAPNNERNRSARALIAVRHIGAAVLYGAGSTLLSQSLLAFSEAYVFRTFFKIFFLVILFGLWHGLLLLPVILSTIGPRSLHLNKEEIKKSIETDANQKVNDEVNVPLNTIQSDN